MELPLKLPLQRKEMINDVTSRSRGYGDVTATYIRRSEIPSRIYTLSISTCKNQSTEARGALYIPTHVYNYKVITRYDTILQEYYIINRRNCENTRRYTSMNSTKGRSRVCRRCHEPTRGRKERTGLQLVCLLRKVTLVLSKKINVSPSSETWT